LLRFAGKGIKHQEKIHVTQLYQEAEIEGERRQEKKIRKEKYYSVLKEATMIK
jgi:hypothetical protein